MAEPPGVIEEISKEKEIYREQLKRENKPENIWDKIIGGKMNKYFEEFCFNISSMPFCFFNHWMYEWRYRLSNGK